jgi:hypothetical protein
METHRIWRDVTGGALQLETHARGNHCVLRFSVDRRAAVAELGAVSDFREIWRVGQKVRIVSWTVDMKFLELHKTRHRAGQD